jgi:hypothetical protein
MKTPIASTTKTVSLLTLLLAPSRPAPPYDEYLKGGDYPNNNYSAYPITALRKSTGTPSKLIGTHKKPTDSKPTTTPCITVAWHSQPGYTPITKTYTTTNVRTFTTCPDTVKSCPLNSSTKTYVTTETETRNTVAETPSSPPTNDKPYTPSKDIGKNSPPSKGTSRAPFSLKGSGFPSPLPQPAKHTGKGPEPLKETKSIQSIKSAYESPEISTIPQPTGKSSVVPPYPTGPTQSVSSIKVCDDMKCS